MLTSKARRLAGVSCAAVLFLASVAPAWAQRVFSDEYLKHISAAKDVTALEDNMFGDSINEYTGSVTFSQVDVSLAGNSALPVSLGRRYVAESKSGMNTIQVHAGLFGDWDLDIPHMQGTYTDMKRMTAVVDRRCAIDGWHDAAPPYMNYFFAEEYWHGNHLYLPGQGESEVLVFDGTTDKPQDGKTYRWVTKDRWYFSCLTATKNGVAGDAFLAISPDGTTYKFDQIVQRSVSGVQKPYNATGGGARVSGPANLLSRLARMSNPTPNIAANGMVGVGRNEVWALPSRIEDRFGNFVDFTYDPVNPWQLTKIEASDGRKITLTYTNNRVSEVSDGIRKWKYVYWATGSLKTVINPDQSTWEIDFVDLSTPKLGSTNDPTHCRHPGNLPPGGIGTIKHPSGATGEFTFVSKWHGRSYARDACQDFFVSPNWADPVYSMDHYPAFFSARSLTSKQISGPGLQTKVWSWNYPGLSYSYEGDCASGCNATKVVTVTQPDLSIRRQTYGTRFAVDDGLLLKSEVLTSAGVVLSTTSTSYVTDPTGQAYPLYVGLSPQEFADFDSGYSKPAYLRQTVQQGVTFKWEVTKSGSAYNFDKYVNPLTVKRSSSGNLGGNSSVTETTTYHHKLDKWVLSQVKAVHNDTVNKDVTRTDYYSATALPWKTYKFALLQQTFAYNADGTLASVTDGRGNAITLGSWYRGIPRDINYPTSFSEHAAVNSIGQVTSTTDEYDYVHGYGYDAAGRLASITYPSDAVNTWNATSRTFAPVTGVEYGIPDGHWKQTLTTGNGRVSTFYDGHWRPVLVLTEIIGNTASRSFVVHRYDVAGRETFVSYPVQSLGMSGVNDLSLNGTSTVYDELGRVRQTLQHSELGVLTTTTEYLNGFQTRVTNPRNVITTTNYQVFDVPSTGAPVKIVSGAGLTEQQTTTIERDLFGKPLSITRSRN